MNCKQKQNNMNCTILKNEERQNNSGQTIGLEICEFAGTKRFHAYTYNDKPGQYNHNESLPLNFKLYPGTTETEAREIIESLMNN